MGLTATNNVFMSTNTQPNRVRHSEVGRLLNAAIVDRQFCDLLLTRPDLALTNGYEGEPFQFNSRERRFFLTTKSTSLADLAKRWIEFYYRNNR
jgi:hypothetical protein